MNAFFMVVFEVGGDVRATTRAIGPRESTRKARAKPLANTVSSLSPACLFARVLARALTWSAPGVPAHPRCAMQGCCRVLDAAMTLRAQENDANFF